MAQNFDFAYNLNGGNDVPATQYLPVAATQTLVVGDLVILSSGKVAKAGDGTAEVLGVMAQNSAAAAVDTLVRVYIAQRGQVYRATADANAASVVQGTKTIDINATTQTVDVGDTTNGCIRIVKLGDVNTEVYVVFSNCALD